ncbi:MAG: spore cortex biosynthesis protein YabQ [Clostridia bacterium]|nr:spore cortex biosynthesis protein YabQ [Clostridia bacterium]
MNELIYQQIKILIIFILTGMCISLLFDFFRIQRKVFKTFDLITYIQDVLFWILSGIILIIVIMKYTNGEIRIYMISGMALGIIIYLRLISKYIIKINTSILRFIIKFIKLILVPLKKFCEILKKSWKKKNNML